jgi:hypothetical protein
MRISTTRWARKARNVRRDARVTACVDDPLSGTYVTFFGDADILDGERELVRHESWPILLRYFHEDEAEARWARIDAEGDRVVIRLTPHKAIWRNGVP